MPSSYCRGDWQCWNGCGDAGPWRTKSPTGPLPLASEPVLSRMAAAATALPQDRMPEAEVSLRLAFHLLDHPASAGEASVALDGAQVRVHGKQVFAVEGFLADQGWKQTSQEGRNPWQGAYERNGAKLIVHASSGVGDVVTHVGNHRILAECKKGPLIHKPGSQERPVLHEAIGQLLTIESLQPNDVLAAAVPLTEPFATLVSRWRLAPLLIESGIRLVMVGRDGSIDGLTLETKA